MGYSLSSTLAIKKPQRIAAENRILRAWRKILARFDHGHGIGPAPHGVRMGIVCSHNPTLVAVAFDQHSEQCFSGAHGEIQAVEIFDRLMLRLGLQAVVITLSRIERGQTLHQKPPLRSAAFEEAETPVGKSVEDAPGP